MERINDKLSKGWYILTPINIGAEIPQTEKGVFYNEKVHTLETFDNIEDYKLRCNELGIEIEEL